MHATKMIAVEIPENLYRQFIVTVTRQEGPWRNRRKPQTFNEAVKTALMTAIMHFLRNLESKNGLPEFRDYMLENYPEIDDDLITMMEDLIKRQKEKTAYAALETNASRFDIPELLKSVGSREKGGDTY